MTLLLKITHHAISSLLLFFHHHTLPGRHHRVLFDIKLLVPLLLTRTGSDVSVLISLCQNVFTNVSMFSNSFDFRIVCVFFGQRLFVINGLFLAGWEVTQTFGSVCFPHSNVHFVGCGNDVFVVGTPLTTENSLHSLCVVHVCRVTVVVTVDVIYSECFVISTCYDFSAGRTETATHDCVNMSF